MSKGYDRQLSVFSPEGKIYQIDYALRAARNSTTLSGLVIKGDGCTVAVCQRKAGEKFVDMSFQTSIFSITDKIGCLAVGHTPDCRGLASKARELAASFYKKNGYEISVEYLTHKVGNMFQLYTQQAFHRLYACQAVFFATEAEGGPQLYKVDPAGHYLGYKGAAVGTKEDELCTAVERHLQKVSETGPGNLEATLITALTMLQNVVSVTLKTTDVEMAVCGASGFRKLSDAEIENSLSFVADKE